MPSATFAVALDPVRLVDRAFVVLELEPGHAVEDGLQRLRRGALAVGILDAQDELPPLRRASR
jgi:hypothetical protein